MRRLPKVNKMELRGKKMGILVAAPPDQPGFRHALGLAQSAVQAGVQVYLYCIDEGVTGIADPVLQGLKAKGLNLFGCAYSAQQRGIALTEEAVFAGLTVVSDLMASTDKFVSFN